MKNLIKKIRMAKKNKRLDSYFFLAILIFFNQIFYSLIFSCQIPYFFIIFIFFITVWAPLFFFITFLHVVFVVFVVFLFLPDAPGFWWLWSCFIYFYQFFIFCNILGSLIILFQIFCKKIQFSINFL